MRNLSVRMQVTRQRRQRLALDRVVACVGSLSALARALDLSYQSVQGWYDSGVPLERCAPIERLTHGAVQCEELREDYALLEDRPYRRPLNAIYLSGPMSGQELLNFPAFHAEARRLRAAGRKVINPAEAVLPQDAGWVDFLRADLIQMLTHCQTICMLPGWDDSQGARLEFHVATALGFDVIQAGAAL